LCIEEFKKRNLRKGKKKQTGIETKENLEKNFFLLRRKRKKKGGGEEEGREEKDQRRKM